MKETQPEGLEEVLLEETLEGEMAEDTYPKAHLDRNERYIQAGE